MNPAQEVKYDPKRQRVRGEKQFEHYLGNTKQTTGRSPLKCYRPGCTKWLKVDDLVVCSEYCRDIVIKECRKILVLLEKDWVVPLPRRRKEEPPKEG